jgi:hypothetical protein
MFLPSFQVISALILMFTVKNMQLYHRDPGRTPVPRAYRRLVLIANKLRCQGGGERSTARVAPVTTETKNQDNRDGQDQDQEMGAAPRQEEAAEPDVDVTRTIEGNLSLCHIKFNNKFNIA